VTPAEAAGHLSETAPTYAEAARIMIALVGMDDET
jgi:hypothetical protein